MSVRHAILGLLAQKPRHGYELHVVFSAVVGDVNWDVKPAQIYTTLNRLEEAGLVEMASDLGEGDEPDRRVYAVTGAGYAALQEWFSAGSAPDHQRDEFFVKVMVALVSGEADPWRLIQTQRAHIFRELHATTQQRDRHDPRAEMAHILLMDKVIMHLEADLRWLDIVESRIEAVKRQPLPEPEIRRRGRPRKGVTEAKDPPAENSKQVYR
ncbi:MAG TPA: helix-turn-helix transcriptional regulator [Anaerolineales bacterium]|nr:helix-turn-helix transcriptional regulator [Anaerolineales bacterium]